ncbi:MAG: ribosome rescue GTPase HflX [Pseudomonadota bacterium]
MLFERPETGERALILQVELQQQENPEVAEFVELAGSAGLEVVEVVTARRAAPHARHFVGSGKVDELRHAVRGRRADLVLINHELSAGQQRNLERALDCRIMTRTELILTIFATRAQSHEGQLQVELAQLQHAQTRLVRGWTHLDRQKGGIGLRGAGEKQIELDQRMLSERIKATQKRLAGVVKRRGQSRRGRRRSGAATVALVGYTNAGKSTLFNRLTDAAVYAEDQLFATLDPTLRRLRIGGLTDVVLADTVGFVSLLPHALVDAFKATLEEVVHADLLLHVVDAADPQWSLRIEQVRTVLTDIGAAQVPEIIVFNKIDLLEPGAQVEWGVLDGLGPDDEICPVSAHTGAGIEDLLAQLGSRLGVVSPHEVVLAPSAGKTRAWLYAADAVVAETVLDDGCISLILQADEHLLAQLRDFEPLSLRASEHPQKISNGHS